MNGRLRSLLHTRGDEETIRALRRVWSELDITWHKGRWCAWPWDGTDGEPIASARTPDGLGTAIREAWVATGVRR